ISAFPVGDAAGRSRTPIVTWAYRQLLRPDASATPLSRGAARLADLAASRLPRAAHCRCFPAARTRPVRYDGRSRHRVTLLETTRSGDIRATSLAGRGVSRHLAGLGRAARDGGGNRQPPAGSIRWFPRLDWHVLGARRAAIGLRALP